MIGLCALTMAAIVTVQIGVLQLHSEQGALKSKLIQMRQDTDALRGKIDRTSDAAKLDKAAVDLGFERIPVQAYRLVPRG